MKSTELRIGNWVNRLGNSTIINSISKDEDHIGYISTLASGVITVNQIEPIPLTEEILLKCGFRKSSSKSPLWTGPDPMLIWMTEYESDVLENLFEFRFGITQSLKAERQVRLDFIHQLQNLYFSLTNKELQINL